MLPLRKKPTRLAEDDKKEKQLDRRRKPEERKFFVFNPYRSSLGCFLPQYIISNPELSFAEKMTWGVLSEFAGKDGQCFPKQSTLAESLGISERYLHDVIRSLRDKEFIITKEPSGSERIQGVGLRYFFVWKDYFLNSLLPGIKLEDITEEITEQEFGHLTDQLVGHLAEQLTRQVTEQMIGSGGGQSFIYEIEKEKKELSLALLKKNKNLTLSKVDAISQFVERILKAQKSRYPRKLKEKEIAGRIIASIDAVEKLMRLDDFSFKDEIVPAIEWAVDDDFWGDQIFSFAGLRNKSKNGEMKFVNLFNQYLRKSRKDESQQNDEDDGTGERPFRI